MKHHFKYWILLLIAILIIGVIAFMYAKSKTPTPSQSVAQVPHMRRKRIRIASPRPTQPTPETPTPAKIITPTPAPTPKVVPKKVPDDEVVIANHDVMVEIAETEATRDQGLSGRQSLAANDGMLFIFQTPDMYAFWMKDMNFPLDFIWIYQGKVTQVTPNVSTEPGVPDEQLQNYLPPGIVDSVLEVNAGWAAKNDIQVGDSVVDQF